jgi:peptide/nickel transport system ATP-binding protein
VTATSPRPAPPAGTVLEVRGLTVSYPKGRGRGGPAVRAVAGVSLDVRAGEIVALVGESGSGKTSIINAVLGLLPAAAQVAADDITIAGQPVDRRRMRAVRGRLAGLVPQDPAVALDPVQRVGNQVAEALAVHRVVPRRLRTARVIELLAAAGLAEPARVARAYPHELSGGMRQRVLIAIAIACGPPLLVADEPTSALDALVQRRLLDHLTGLVAGGRVGMLLVTHDLAMAAERADRLLVLHRGELAEEGPAGRVFQAPEHPYTRQLLAARPGLAVRPGPAETGSSQTAGAGGLTASGLGKAYPGRGRRQPVLALDGVDLTVRRGETHGLVGESGSGKSTLARLLLRLEPPTSGSVSFDGADITARSGRDLREFRRRVQLVAQNPYAAIDPRYTAAEAIAEPLRAFRLGRRDQRGRRVAELADQVALPRALLGRPARQLSGGQCQRVAIARALACEPDIVVCDEAVSALDVTVQAQILALLAELQARLGVGYLFISHDLAVVADIASRVSVMRAGRIVETGHTRQVIETPSHPYARALVAAAPHPLPPARPPGDHPGRVEHHVPVSPQLRSTEPGRPG